MQYHHFKMLVILNSSWRDQSDIINQIKNLIKHWFWYNYFWCMNHFWSNRRWLVTLAWASAGSANEEGCVPPFGFQNLWHGLFRVLAENFLNFLNYVPQPLWQPNFLPFWKVPQNFLIMLRAWNKIANKLSRNLILQY